jgi:hypothetical protein
MLEKAEEAHKDHQARLRESLGDNDPLVFLTCLRSLAQLGGAPEAGD